MTFTPMAIGLLIFIICFVLLGSGMVYLVRGSGKRYIICGKSLSFFFVGTMLMAQAIDSNGTVASAGQAYEAGFWAGFVFPLGVVICMIITALLFAKPLNRMNLLTLPDFFYRRFDSTTELLTSFMMGLSFIFLVSGNFAGAGWIVSSIFEVDYTFALILIATLIFIYTCFGGLFSCAATDVIQMYPAIFGFVGAAIWLLNTHGWDYFSSAIPPSFLSMEGLTSVEGGALLNWSVLAAVGLGDVVALDFMERVFAAKDGRTAQMGCLYAAVLTFIVGGTCAFIGLMGLKLVGAGATDPRTILPAVAMDHVPFVFGLLMMAGVVGAGASTANGGILGISTVLGRNIYQKNIQRWMLARQGKEMVINYDEESRRRFDARLLLLSRIMSVPVVIVAIWVAHVKPEPGILLALAFDVVLAGCFFPLLLGVHWKKCNTPGALSSVVICSIIRLIAHFTCPEDLVGLDTLIPPIISFIMVVAVSLATQKTHPPKHYVIDEIPDETDVLAGKC